MLRSAGIMYSVLVWLAGCHLGQAQDMSESEIKCKLDPGCAKPKMRGLRGIKIVGDPVLDSPNSASFQINFEYDSARLASDSLITLDRLGSALRDGSLSTYDFLIAGHTDGKGSEAYNQSLSERRAAAVRDYLVTTQHVPPQKLTVKGYGKQFLLNAEQPEDAVNRRVQVVNQTAARN